VTRLHRRYLEDAVTSEAWCRSSARGLGRNDRQSDRKRSCNLRIHIRGRGEHRTAVQGVDPVGHVEPGLRVGFGPTRAVEKRAREAALTSSRSTRPHSQGGAERAPARANIGLVKRVEHQAPDNDRCANRGDQG